MMLRRSVLVCVVAFPILFGAIGLLAGQGQGAQPMFSPEDLQAFSALEPVDTHAHAFRADERFIDFLRTLHLHLLDIVVAAKEEGTGVLDLERKIDDAKSFVKASKGTAVLCTTFDPFQWTNETFAEDAVRQLNRDFAQGAVAVKIWKNVGMEVKDRSGRFVLPDDPRLNPIYQDISAQGKTLIAHLAEPDSCWQPPNENSPDYHYYSEHPQWYMFRQPDHPRKETIIRARDHMLEAHPQLHVIGAHLGSLEANLDELGRTLDRYPNFAVDVAARTVYLTIQPREKVRQFLIQYQDRIVYGTDLDLAVNGDAAAAQKSWAERYAADWAFYSSGHTVRYRGREVEGVALPAPVLHKLYHDNAVHWIPGVVAGTSK